VPRGLILKLSSLYLISDFILYLIAFSGMPSERPGALVVTLSRNMVRAFRSWGRDVVVTNGIQRKCVSFSDLGGIFEATYSIR
jgi:hypothetical protein